MFESSKKDAETQAKPLWSTIGPIFNEGSTHHRPKNCKLSPASKCTKSSTVSEDTGKSLLVTVVGSVSVSLFIYPAITLCK